MHTGSIDAAETDLGKPPKVTAKAWVVADGGTAQVIASHRGDEKRKAASTAKIMCAYTVLTLAEKEPAVLDERMVFSELAGSIPGSTAAIKVGESVSVRDCLFGMLLPSGNDAGTALGEHFNERFAPPDVALLKLGLDEPKLASRRNFVAQMNRHARELAMKNTIYRSPYGDGGTENDRTTTAFDLSLLAGAAMRMESFRNYVRTRKHEAVVTMNDGTVRTAQWENTNPLLALDLGFDGVKTGLTNQAGNCLVASVQREGRHLIVVVLGSSSEAARDADVKMLTDWTLAQSK